MSFRLRGREGVWTKGTDTTCQDVKVFESTVCLSGHAQLGGTTGDSSLDVGRKGKGIWEGPLDSPCQRPCMPRGGVWT